MLHSHSGRWCCSDGLFIRVCPAKGRQYQGDDQGKQSPEVGQDLPDVVAAAAEDGKNGIAESAFEGATCKAAVGFHAADFSFDGAVAARVGDEFRRPAAKYPADQHPRLAFLGNHRKRRAPLLSSASISNSGTRGTSGSGGT